MDVACPGKPCSPLYTEGTQNKNTLTAARLGVLL